MRVDGRSLAVTMRTPGRRLRPGRGIPRQRGRDLADPRARHHALLRGRGRRRRQPLQRPRPQPRRATWRPRATSVARAFFTTSSCGLCGKASIDAVRTRSRFDVARRRACGVATDAPGLAARSTARGPDGVRHDRWACTRRPSSTRDRRAARAARGRGSPQRGRQGRGLGPARRALAPARVRSCWCRAARPSNSSRRRSWRASRCSARCRRRRRSPSTSPSDSGLTLVGFLRDPSMVVYAGAQRVVDATSSVTTSARRTQCRSRGRPRGG